jgi:hypothetical protein
LFGKSTTLSKRFILFLLVKKLLGKKQKFTAQNKIIISRWALSIHLRMLITHYPTAGGASVAWL